MVLTNYRFSDREIKLIGILYLFLNVFYVWKSENLYSSYYYNVYNDIKSINPNILAYVLLFTSMVLVAYVMEKIYINRHFKIRTFFLALCIAALLAGNLYGISNFNVRGSYYPLLLYVIICVIVLFKKNSLSKNKWILFFYWSVVILSVIIPILYVYLYSQGTSLKLGAGGIEKNFFSGREIIWTHFFQTINESLLDLFFGIGSNGLLIGFNAAEDLHNNTFALITNYGLIITVLYYSYIFYKIKRMCIRGMDKISCLYVCAFICSMINGFFEATVYFSPIFLMMNLLIGLAEWRQRKRMEYENSYSN